MKEAQLDNESLGTALNDFLFVFHEKRETEFAILADVMTGKCRCAHPDSMGVNEEILNRLRASDLRDRSWDEISTNFVEQCDYSDFFNRLRGRAEGEFHYCVYLVLRDLDGAWDLWEVDGARNLREVDTDELIDGYRAEGLTVAQAAEKLYVELECRKMETGAHEAE
jgi:hypothetical protein